MPLSLAAAYETADDWKNVERAASRAITAGSSEVETLVRRGWARIHLGRPGLGRRRFRQALEREPDSAAFRLGLFLAMAERGDLTDANAHWRQVIDDQDEPRTDRWNNVSAHLSRLTKSRPEMLVVLARSWPCQHEVGSSGPGRGRLRQGDRGQSRRWLELAGSRPRPQEPQPDRSRRWPTSRRSVALEPNVPAAWAMRGEILGSLGRWDEAARAFERWSALGGDPQRDSLVFPRRSSACTPAISPVIVGPARP